jgi:hypothetical protein
VREPATEAGRALVKTVEAYGLPALLGSVRQAVFAIEAQSAAEKIDIGRLARALEAEAKSGRWTDEWWRGMRWASETLAACLVEEYKRT